MSVATQEKPFVLKPAVRENVPLLIGLAGGTGSGKTYSAMRLAAGLSNGQRFAVIDTESGRAKAYADEFQFDHGELTAPFRPETYERAILAVDAMHKYPVIVVDSASHEYAGEGGLLDWQEDELTRMAGDDWKKRESCKMASWIKPKMAHKAYVQKLLQIRSHLILCFRAEPKTEMVKQDGKMVVQPKKGLTGLDGWFPLCEKNMPFELTAYFLLTADKPGIPQPIKLMDRHRPFFQLDKPITEEAGRQLAAWARGGTSPAVSARSDGDIHKGPPLTAEEFFDKDDVRDIETACSDAGVRMSVVVDKLMRDFGTVEKTPKTKKAKILEWIEAKAKQTA